MTRIIAWFVNNPVAANLLMAVLVVGGLISLSQLRQEEFPKIDLGFVRVQVPYLGAAPEEVESGVCIRIEEALEGVQNIFRMTSNSLEGSCTVNLELESGADDIEALNDIKGRVDAISTFPVETERPVVSLLTSRNEGLEIAISGNADERSLKNIALQMREEIAAMEGISTVEIAYVRADEIAIEVSEQTLRRYGLTLDQVANAVRRSSLDLPGGTIRTGGGEILVRTKGQAYRGTEFEDIVVVSRGDGTTITLGEIATIRDGFEEGDLSVRFDGQPAAMVIVYQVGNEDIIDIRDKVRTYIDGAQQRMPDGITLTIWQDESEQIEARVSVLLGTASGGLALVLLLLSLPLHFRLAMWVAAGIPIAMLGTLALFAPFGLTINTMSIVGFILVLGVVVDDAIVVGERVYAHERQAENQISAAIEGTAEVAVPVIFGVLTTMAAFIPVLFAPGRIGQFFSVIGYVVVICLVFSIIESQLILPAHLAHRRIAPRSRRSNPFIERWLDFQEQLSERIENFAEQRYGNALTKVLEWRYLALAAGVGVLTLALALIVSGRIAVQFFPNISGDQVVARLTMPEGIPVESTMAAARQIESASEILSEELNRTRPDQPPVIQHVLTTIGLRLANGGPGGGLSSSLAAPVNHQADIGLSLLPAAERGELSSDEIANRWRELTGPIPDSVELTFSASQLTVGDAISIQIRGRNVNDLAAAAADIRAELARFDGVTDISDSFRPGKQEVRLSLRPEAQNLGLTLNDLARQTRQAFYGEEAQRVQRGTEDVRVMVRYPESERRSIGDLEDMRIRTQTGTEVPFAAAAEFALGQGYSTITRINRQRVVTVRADVDRNVTTPEAVLGSLAAGSLPEIIAGYRGVSFALTGEREEREESFGGLTRLFPIALLIMFAILAIPLRSYLQPIIIMSVIPFGAIGAVVGHLLMGKGLSIASITGMIALSGVVMNSSLILVDYINRLRRQGFPVQVAVQRAGITRFRPILLTSVTTFAGLTPLMLTDTPGTAFIVPIAISLAWGVVFATVITLFLVPSLFLILEEITPATEESIPRRTAQNDTAPAHSR
jgi:multidrug efflux pump subunit AcrB